jgi:Na+-driven multidrug efflux pump
VIDVSVATERLAERVASLMERLSLIDQQRGRRVNELVWPRIVTGFARISQRVADIVMIGIVLGPTGIAGIAFASAFWQVGNMIALGLSGGAVSLISRRFGSEGNEGIGWVIRTSAVLGLVLAVPFGLAFWFGAERLVGVLSDSPESVAFGATYLQVMALGTGFMFLNKIGSRALIGANDARTPMLIRSLGATVNVVLNAVFLFGLGMGMAGVALGTVLALGLVTSLFAVGLLTGRIPGVGSLPIRVSPFGGFGKAEGIRELLEISVPLAVRRVVLTGSARWSSRRSR